MTDSNNEIELDGSEGRLTDEQKAAYLKDSDVCPFCQVRDQMEAEGFDFFGKDWCSRVVTCQACNKEWSEIFGLKLIDDV